MDETLNTTLVDSIDLSSVLDAVNFYQAGKFNEAIVALQSVLKMEPDNSEARLMLAVSYYKTGQLTNALAAFRRICEQSKDPELQTKAIEGARVTSAKLNKNTAAAAYHENLSWLSK
ncbi:MAG: tetratricopeptide repeat protein [Candidatus Obscuribacterales bacterium]|nr:tetratricopeptide repeat protein [Candidatus Obscuribacterales bacterium]